ncbi:nicotinamide riboside kinase 1 [Clonorchis sinensis]|uniref:Nicotinamide riboside kinase 1 n=1 Tax=Clonorchis sinensis TaxID=79923 RepID=G7YK20_CLOSI|nr:nicotinamide riboside kinase 1 [Clonorchis sinensis]
MEHFTSKGMEVKVISMDDYYWRVDDPHHVRNPESGFPNFDCYSAVDWESLIEDVRRWSSHEPAGVRSSKPNRCLFVEGIFVLECETLFQMFDVSIFLKLNYETMLERRLLREYDPPDPPNYFKDYVWPAYCKSLENVSSRAGRTIYVECSGLSFEDMFRRVLGCINDKLGIRD